LPERETSLEKGEVAYQKVHWTSLGGKKGREKKRATEKEGEAFSKKRVEMSLHYRGKREGGSHVLVVHDEGGLKTHEL